MIFDDLVVGGKFWLTSGSTIVSGPYYKREHNHASDLTGVLYWIDSGTEVMDIPGPDKVETD